MRISTELNKDENFYLDLKVFTIFHEWTKQRFNSFFDQQDTEVQIKSHVNNNEFKYSKNKSELTCSQQLRLYFYRSLPQLDNNTRYEPIHDTENYNFYGCQKTCDCSNTNKYQGLQSRFYG